MGPAPPTGRRSPAPREKAWHRSDRRQGHVGAGGTVAQRPRAQSVQQHACRATQRVRSIRRSPNKATRRRLRGSHGQLQVVCGVTASVPPYRVESLCFALPHGKPLHKPLRSPTPPAPRCPCAPAQLVAMGVDGPSTGPGVSAKGVSLSALLTLARFISDKVSNVLRAEEHRDSESSGAGSDVAHAALEGKYRDAHRRPACQAPPALRSSSLPWMSTARPRSPASRRREPR